MLPAAKVLLVTALLGGGTVGTYALAGGKFGTGGSGADNAETTAQVSTNEAITPATDGQARAEEGAPAAPRREETLEVGAEDRGSSDTLADADPEKALENTDSSPSPKVGPEVEEAREKAVEGQQQGDPKVDGTPPGDGQKQESSGPKDPGVSEGEKTSLEGESNEPRTDSRSGAGSGQQNVESSNERGAQENGAAQDNQVAANLPESNVGRDGQPAAVPMAQDQGNVNSVNQVDKAVNPNENTGGPNPVGEDQA